MRPHPDAAGVCWGISIQQGEMSKGQTICWCVQDTSNLWKSAEGQETDKEAVRVSWQQRVTKEVYLEQIAYF
jgi:hypothetical protein